MKLTRNNILNLLLFIQFFVVEYMKAFEVTGDLASYLSLGLLSIGYFINHNFKEWRW